MPAHRLFLVQLAYTAQQLVSVINAQLVAKPAPHLLSAQLV